MPRKKKIKSYRKQRQHQRDYMRRKRYEEALYPAKKTCSMPSQTESNQGQCSKISEMIIKMESGSSDSHMYTIDEEKLACKAEMKALDENQGQITKQQKKMGVKKMKSSRHRTHKGDKQLKCDVCGKTFGRLTTLLGHLRIHRGDKRHKCEVCDKAFIYPRDLQIHLRKHSEDKPYKCDVCGMAFKLSKSLHIHLERYKCDQFKNLVEKRTCDICGRMFLAQSSLQSTGERQNTCDNCHKALSQNGSVTIVWV